MKKIIFILSQLLFLNLFATDTAMNNPKEMKLSLYDKMHVHGDLRLRHQEVHRDDKDNTYEQRYRMRLGLTYNINDYLSFEGQVASGKDNPTSTNVNMADGIHLDYFKIDILDLKWNMSNVDWLRVGKSKHYFYRPMKTQLIWDNDLRPEGVSYGHKDDVYQFTTAIWKVHRINDEQPEGNIYMYVGQYVYTQHYADCIVHLGGGIYHYVGVQGSSTPYEKGPLGNSYDGVYEHDYSIAEGLMEVTFPVFSRPLQLGVTVAYNMAIADHNRAYDLSTQYGKIKKDFDWKLGYTYRYLERDPVFGANNDSDFIGGGTDGRGHIFTAKVQLQNHIDMAGHFQFSKKYIDSDKEESDYDRVMLDIIFKF